MNQRADKHRQIEKELDSDTQMYILVGIIILLATCTIALIVALMYMVP